MDGVLFSIVLYILMVNLSVFLFTKSLKKSKIMHTYKSDLPEICIRYKTGPSKKIKISNSTAVFELLKELFNTDTVEIQEEFICILLNRANNTLGWYRVSCGGITGTVADPRLIFAVALKAGATGLIIAHNHPSGGLTPSSSDIDLNRKIKQAGELLDIHLLDSVIYTPEKQYSFADAGLL